MIAAAVLALATSFAAWFIEQHELAVVYPFDPTRSAPADRRLAETGFITADGERLVLWIAHAASGKPTLVYFPGNAGTLTARAPRFSAVLDRGYGLVAVAYRGSSGSSGSPDEAALTADAAAVLDGLGALLVDRPEPLVLYGESLGAALAVKLAAGGRGDALILEAPFTSIPDLVAVQYPGEDIRRAFTQTWNTRVRVSQVRQPLLVLHGEADRLVPLAQGREIYERAGSVRKTFAALAGAGHADLWSETGRSAIWSFIDGLSVRPARQAGTPRRSGR